MLKMRSAILGWYGRCLKASGMQWASALFFNVRKCTVVAPYSGVGNHPAVPIAHTS